MSLYLRVRALQRLILVAMTTLVFLAWPGSSLSAMPSPTGATMVLGVIVAIAAPIAVGWACARGDARFEVHAVRRIGRMDLVYALLVCGPLAAAAAMLHSVGLADAGLAAARAMLVYLGLLLLTATLWGWRLAPVTPTLLLLAVAVFGRGADIAHAAPWAFIAADEADPLSWGLTAMTLGAGLLFAATVRQTPPPTSDFER